MKTYVRALLVGLIVVGAASLSGGVTYGAFNSTTAANTNAVSSGTVALADNDGGTALLTLTGARPNATASSCIKVTSTGSLPSTVEQWGTLTGTLGPYLKLKVTRGTDSNASFRSCTNFTADTCNYTGNGNGVVYSGDLSAFPTSEATGLIDYANCTPTTPESWDQSEAHSYRYDITFPGTDPAAEGKSATFTVTWLGVNS